MKDNIKRYVLEALATFMFVFIGAGAFLASGSGVLEIALASGLVLAGLVYAVGARTGAHLNPAITTSLWFTKRISSKDAVGYVFSQLAGAVIAGFILLAWFSNAGVLGAGVPELGSGVSAARGIGVEAVLAFLLTFVYYATFVDPQGSKGHAALGVGFTYAASYLVGSGVSGAVLNPARAFGPAFASGVWSNQLVYWIGPLLGAIAAALFYEYYILGNLKKAAKKAPAKPKASKKRKK